MLSRTEIMVEVMIVIEPQGRKEALPLQDEFNHKCGEEKAVAVVRL